MILLCELFPLCTVQYSIMLFIPIHSSCTVLYCTMPCCSFPSSHLCCTVLHRAMLFISSLLYCTAPCYAVHSPLVISVVLYCIVLCCSFPCNHLCCTVLHRAMLFIPLYSLYCTVLYCSLSENCIINYYDKFVIYYSIFVYYPFL